MAGSDAIAVRLRTARVLRKLNEFDRADWFYVEAGLLAEMAGGRSSELLSRIGRGYTLLGRGNLMGAEQQLREGLRDAEHLIDRRNPALAHQGVGRGPGTGGR